MPIKLTCDHTCPPVSLGAHLSTYVHLGSPCLPVSTWEHTYPPVRGRTCPPASLPAKIAGRTLHDILKAGMCSVLTSIPSSAQGLAPGGSLLLHTHLRRQGAGLGAEGRRHYVGASEDTMRQPTRGTSGPTPRRWHQPACVEPCRGMPGPGRETLGVDCGWPGYPGLSPRWGSTQPHVLWGPHSASRGGGLLGSWEGTGPRGGHPRQLWAQLCPPRPTRDCGLPPC